MTEQLNQVYAYLLKIEEASRKDVTGIQFAFEAGGYAKAAMAICESALNWPKHSNVEVQAKRKTPFDFGAVRNELNEPIFLSKSDCQSYCDYLNSISYVPPITQEVQSEQKTGFDFGATRIPPKHGDSYWAPSDKNEPWRYEWESDKVDFQLLKLGKVFIYPTDCQAYCNYLNSLSNED